MRTIKIKTINYLGKHHVYCPEVKQPHHNLITHSGIVAHNSIVHAIPYSYLGYTCAYLKYHYASEFYTANLTEECSQQDRERFVDLIREAQAGGIEILSPHINHSHVEFNLDKTQHGNYYVYPIRFGLCGVKGLGEKGLNKILENKPKDGFLNLNSLIKVCDVKTFACLLRAGALDDLSFENSTCSGRREKLTLFKELKKSKAKAEVHNAPSLADEQEALGLILNPKSLFDKYINKFEELKDETTDPSLKKLNKFDLIGIAGIIIQKQHAANYKTLHVLAQTGFVFKIYIGEKHLGIWNLSVGDGIAGIVMFLEDDRITINDSKGRCYLKRIEDVNK